MEQYVEDAPTATGQTPTQRPPDRPNGAPSTALPPDVVREVERRAGAEADDLEAVAEAPQLGAPSMGPAHQRRADGRRARGTRRAPSTPSDVAAVRGASGQGPVPDDAAPIGWMLLGLFVTGIGAVVVARSRARAV